MRYWARGLFGVAMTTGLLIAPTATTAWQVEEDWPMNGGGYCRMISRVGESKTGEVIMIVQMALDFQGLAFFFREFPNASAKDPTPLWVDDGPRLNASSRWNSDSLVVPFRVSSWINEWPIFEHMFITGSVFRLDYDGDQESDLAISLDGAREAHARWTECINRRE